MADTATPSEIPAGETAGHDGTSGIPAYKVRHGSGGIAFAIRFELSAADLAALLYAHCYDEDPLSLSDQEIHELAVMAMARLVQIAVREARQEVLHDRETQSGSPDDEADCIVAREFLACCEQRAAGITQVPAVS